MHVVVQFRLYLVPLSVTDTEAVCMLSNLGNDTRTLFCMATAIILHMKKRSVKRWLQPTVPFTICCVCL